MFPRSKPKMRKNYQTAILTGESMLSFSRTPPCAMALGLIDNGRKLDFLKGRMSWRTLASLGCGQGLIPVRTLQRLWSVCNFLLVILASTASSLQKIKIFQSYLVIDNVLLLNLATFDLLIFFALQRCIAEVLLPFWLSRDSSHETASPWPEASPHRTGC